MCQKIENSSYRNCIIPLSSSSSKLVRHSCSEIREIEHLGHKNTIGLKQTVSKQRKNSRSHANFPSVLHFETEQSIHFEASYLLLL